MLPTLVIAFYRILKPSCFLGRVGPGGEGTNLVLIILVIHASFLNVATNWKALYPHLPALRDVLQVAALNQSA